MSKCISSHGEYSDHEFGGDAPEFVCRYCWVFDEDAALKELVKLRATVTAVRKVADSWRDSPIGSADSPYWLGHQQREEICQQELRAALDDGGAS